MQLTKDAVGKLLASDSLTSPSRLLRYLQRRHYQIGHWFSLRNNLEDSLTYNKVETSTSGLNHIRNLLSELESLSISITPDEPENGHISVQGILSAPIGGEQNQGKGTQSSSASGASLSSSSPSHQGKGDSHNQNNDRDQKDNSPPPPNPSFTSTSDTPGFSELNIQEVLEKSGFNEVFREHVQYFVLGLYSYGQLDYRQLYPLFLSAYVPRHYVASTGLVNTLARRGNRNRAEALSVILWLAKDLDTQLYDNIINNTPVQWRKEIQKTPLNTPDRAFDKRDQLSRFLAQLILRYVDSPSLFNALRRANILSACGLRSDYPAIVLIQDVYEEDQTRYSSIIETIEQISDVAPSLPSPFEDLLNSPVTEEVTAQNTLEDSEQAVPQLGQTVAEKRENEGAAENEPLAKKPVMDVMERVVAVKKQYVNSMVKILLDNGLPAETLRLFLESDSLNTATVERLLLDMLLRKSDQPEKAPKNKGTSSLLKK